MDIIKQIENYAPFNEQEERDKTLILHCMKNFDNVFTRDCEFAHVTGSAWITNGTHDKVLMAYHNIYDSWSWLGGHADGETDLLSVAVREAKEESGISKVKAVSRDIFSLEVLPVEGHVKKGRYVSPHLHLNVTFLLEADEGEALCVKPDENSAVSWFTPEEAIKSSSEKWFRDNIYKKLNEKMAAE